MPSNIVIPLMSHDEMNKRNSYTMCVLSNHISGLPIEHLAGSENIDKLCKTHQLVECRSVVEEVVKDRLDPRHMFGDIVHDPDTLMDAMAASHSFLSGSRAANFFTPGLCDEDSDWDFFCIGTRHHAMLLYLYFKNQGYRLCAPADSGRDDGENTSTVVLESDYPSSFRVLTMSREDDDGITRVQLMHCMESSPVEVVSNFHSTVVQCYVSATRAVSLYPLLTSNMKALQSTRYRYDDDRSLECKKKYESRGVEYISMTEAESDVYQYPDGGHRRLDGACNCTCIDVSKRRPDTPSHMVWAHVEELCHTKMDWSVYIDSADYGNEHGGGILVASRPKGDNCAWLYSEPAPGKRAVPTSLTGGLPDYVYKCSNNYVINVLEKASLVRYGKAKDGAVTTFKDDLEDAVKAWANVKQDGYYDVTDVRVL